LLLLLFNISPSRVKKCVRALQTDRGQHQEGPKRGGLLGRKEPANNDNDDTCFQIHPAGNVHGIANTTGFQSLERTQTRGPAHEQNTNQPPTYLPPEKSCYPQRKCRLIPARPLPVSGRTQWEGRNPLEIFVAGEQSAVHYLRACRRCLGGPVVSAPPPDPPMDIFRRSVVHCLAEHPETHSFRRLTPRAPPAAPERTRRLSQHNAPLTPGDVFRGYIVGLRISSEKRSTACFTVGGP
jgi:hypothetical protein